MPTCTDAERALIELNVSTGFDRGALWKARRAVRLERLPADIREKAVRLYMASFRARDELAAYIQTLEPLGVLDGDHSGNVSIATLLE